MGRADLCNKNIMTLLKKAGLTAVKLGVESANKNILLQSEKNLDIASVEKTVKMCRKLGIKTHLTFTFGLFGENAETVKETINFAQKINPDSVQFSIATPFPGTKFYNDLLQKHSLDNMDWNQFDGNRTTVIKDNEHNLDLEKILIKAEKAGMHILKGGTKNEF